MKRALFISGGWERHKPDAIVALFSVALKDRGFGVEIQTDLACLTRIRDLASFDLIFPCWTMGELTPDQSSALVSAVRAGANLGGIHGGMGDAFRGNLAYEWMVGGHFVGHPTVGNYTVRIADRRHPITSGLPAEFEYDSEQYYMLVDPGNHVLADTQYNLEGRTVTMPVAWTKHWGEGRVFYHSLGHDPVEFQKYPAAMSLTVRGLLWAAGEIHAPGESLSG